MPGKKKKYNARFPPARIKKIMQTDEDVGKVAAAVPVIISRSLELFIDSLIERTASITRAKNAKTLSTSHIKQAIYSEKTFDFLRDLVKSVPDHQVDEDGDGSVASGSGPQEKKPKPAKPRKPREEGARGRGRPRKVKPEPEVKKSSSSDEEDDEETETDEEQTSQEETGPSDQTSSSPACNPVQTPAQQSFTPPQALHSRLYPSQDPPASPQASISTQQNSRVSSEQLTNPPFTQPLMTHSPFQPQQTFPMHNYGFPQYVIPPGGATSLVPPPFLPPGTTSISTQHSPLAPPLIGQGMMPYPPFIPPLSPFSGPPDGHSMGPNGTQNTQPLTPGFTGAQITTTSGQSIGQPASRTEPTNHHDANMPLDMSISGKSRHLSQSQSQGGAGTERPTQLAQIPVPRGLPSLIPQGYSAPPQVQATATTQPPLEQIGHPGHAQPMYQHSISTDYHPVGNKAISENTDTNSQKGDNSAVSVSQKETKAAVNPEDTARQKTGTQDKEKGLVSFPGLSDIMKVNSLRPVNNNDDDDYDT